MSVDYTETACDLGLTNWPDDRKIILTMLTEDGPALYHETNLRLSYRTCMELIRLLQDIMSGKAKATHNGDCEYYVSDDCPSFFDTCPGEDEEADE